MNKTPSLRKDSGIQLEYMYERDQEIGFFTLPPEIRTLVYEHLFNPQESHSKAFLHQDIPDHRLNEDYYASDSLLPLLVNRQFHAEAHLLAFSRTTFVIRNPYTAKAVPGRLRSRLPREGQISSIRSIAFIAEADHFRQMRNWRGAPFGVPELNLEELDILLYRSSYWHYLFDFNSTVISTLRTLEGVKRLRWCKNQSRVKPHFHTWFDRLVAAMLRANRFERFGCHTGAVRAAEPGGELYQANVGMVEWDWEFDGLTQTASLVARPAMRADMGVLEYDSAMEGTMGELARSIASEAFDPDPMSRNG